MAQNESCDRAGLAGVPEALILVLDSAGCILSETRSDQAGGSALPPLAAGQAFADHLHPEDQDAFEALRRWAAGEAGRRATLVLRLGADDGTWRGGRSTVTGSGDGNVTVELCLIDTLLARVAHEHLRDALERAPQGVLVRTAEGRILYVNPALPAMMGYSREEFLATGNVTPHLHPDDRPLVTARAYARVSNQDVPTNYEFRFMHRDGSTLWAETHATHAVWNGAPVSLAWIADITARKHAEEALRRSEQLFVKLFRENPDIVILSAVDDGRFLDVNEAFLKASGRSRAEIIGRTSVELGVWTTELRRRVFDRLRRDGRVREVVSLKFSPTAEPRDYSLSAELVAFEDQNLALTVCHDITEQRREEEQRWRSQKLEALGTLAGGIAHDLNNTLVPVLSLTKLTAKRLPEGSREHQNLMTVLHASERARDLVKQILAFSREEKAERSEIDLAQVLREAMEMLRASVPATIRLETEIAGEATLLGDAGQLHQVIINLVTNAAQAIGTAMGRIAVTLSTKRRGGEGKPGSEWICLSVTDTGCGMDEATLRRIFEPFFTTKKVGEGTGLGLAVVHGIVTSHGGHIDVASTPGGGTTFTVQFPALAARHKPVAAVTAAQ